MIRNLVSYASSSSYSKPLPVSMSWTPWPQDPNTAMARNPEPGPLSYSMPPKVPTDLLRPDPAFNITSEIQPVSSENKTMKYILKTSIPLVILCLIPIIIVAQPGLPVAPDQAPIDGGLGLLAAAGGVYAIRKLRQRKK